MFVREKKGRCLGIVWLASFLIVLADIQLRLKTQADGGWKDDYEKTSIITILLEGGGAGESICELPAAMSAFYEWRLRICTLALYWQHTFCFRFGKVAQNLLELGSFE